MTETTPRKAGVFLSDAGGLPPVRGIVRAIAPALPNTSNREPVDLTTTIPPFGSNAISSGKPALPPVSSTDLASRVLYNDPRDLWYLSLPSKLTPAQVVQILRSALGGDLWQQWQLQKLMSDSWVMFRKCAHELRSSASTARYTVSPYHAPGKQPTASAKAKAEMVNRGFESFRPDPFTDEKGFNGAVYHWTDAVLSGVSLCEVQWQLLDGGDILPRAVTWVHPRQFTFSNGGRISVWDRNFKAMIVPDPDKFIPMQYLSDSGSALGCGLVRPLAKYFSAMVFNWEWMIKFGQKHGAGFIKAFYPDGATDAEIQKLKQFCQEAQNQAYILLRKDKEDAEYTQPANLGQDNPHHRLCEIADEAAQMLLLGQTESTQGSSGKSGGLNSNSGELQGSVRAQKLFEVSHQVATGPLTQLARAICRVNFDGDDTECPVITADFSEDEDPKDVVGRIAALLGSQLPVLASDIYPQLKLTQPNDGDVVVIGGKVGTMAGKADALNAKGEGATPRDENGHAIPEPTVDENGKPVQNSAVKAMLSGLSDEDFAELSGKFVAAMQAPHKNGELKELEVTVNRLAKTRK